MVVFGDDLRLIETIMKVELDPKFDRPISKLPQDTKDMLIANNYSLLMKINIPELSRLNTQKGLFLWDFLGCLSSLIVKNHIGIRLVFKHYVSEQTAENNFV